MQKLLVLDEQGNVDIDATRANVVRANENTFHSPEDVAALLIREVSELPPFSDSMESSIERAAKHFAILREVFAHLPGHAIPNWAEWRHSFINHYWLPGSIAVALDSLADNRPDYAQDLLALLTKFPDPRWMGLLHNLDLYWRLYAE